MNKPLTYCQVALLALTPKGATVTASSLASATSWKQHVVEQELQGLVEAGQLVQANGGYRLPEKVIGA